jgi:hypothetical protein
MPLFSSPVDYGRPSLCADGGGEQSQASKTLETGSGHPRMQPARGRVKSSAGRNIERTTVDAAAGEDRALSRMIGRADDAFLFHPLDERGRFIVTDR